MAESSAAVVVQVEQPMPVVVQKQEEAPKKRASTSRRKSSSKKSGKIIFVKSKRKTSVARASARPGTGRIRINGFDIKTIEPTEHRKLMLEPISVSNITKETFRGMDIYVSVYGGGSSSQAQAVRGAIAKSIVAFSGVDEVKKQYMHYDRFMVVDDARRVEPKKFKGPKARARFQKSYR